MARQRTPQGPPPAPVVQRLRVRYARRARLRFSSTRDFARAFERALRRAGVPMAFSAGFHPHPRISYAGAAPTGMASEAEYLEIGLAERVDPEAVRVALDEALPEGLDVLEVVEGGPGALADRLQASLWRIELPGTAPESAAEVVHQLLGRPVAEVTRTFKTGPKTFDVLPAVVRLTVDQSAPSVDSCPAPEPPCAILTLVVRHTTPATRPDDVLTALRANGLVPMGPARVTRLAQGPLTATAAVADPLAADEDAVRP